MTNRQFRKIRESLELTQADLASVLGYAHVMSISKFERETNPSEIPRMVAWVMEALASGWRPKDWPKGW